MQKPWAERYLEEERRSLRGGLAAGLEGWALGHLGTTSVGPVVTKLPHTGGSGSGEDTGQWLGVRG